MYFELDFCRLHRQFEIDKKSSSKINFVNYRFQKSSADQQGDSCIGQRLIKKSLHWCSVTFGMVRLLSTSERWRTRTYFTRVGFDQEAFNWSDWSSLLLKRNQSHGSHTTKVINVDILVLHNKIPSAQIMYVCFRVLILKKYILSLFQQKHKIQASQQVKISKQIKSLIFWGTAWWFSAVGFNYKPGYKPCDLL